MVESKPIRWASLVVPFLAAMVPLAVYRYVKPYSLHPVLGALFAGTVVAALALALFRVPFLREEDGLARAVLCGVLVAETLLFHSKGIPSLTSVSLFLFLYFWSTEHGHAL